MSLADRRYPRSQTLARGEVQLTTMSRDDLDAVVAFAASLPPHDLLFLKRDITHAKVAQAWSSKIESGEIVSLLARDGSGAGPVLGCTALVRDPISFSPHVGEVRVLVSPDARDLGLGRVLIQESFLLALDLGMDKLTAQMTVDQQGAITLFQDMGFVTEGLLRNHVQDRTGLRHDLVLLSQDVARFQATMDAYGLTDR